MVAEYPYLVSSNPDDFVSDEPPTN